MNHNACVFCSSTDLALVQRRISGSRSGVAYSFISEHTVCESCHEEYLSHEQSLAHSRARATAIRAAGALLGPDQIRNARLALGFTQSQFELALGVGPKTVVRWERGTIAPSQAANGLLWIALHHPSVFRDYARERGVALPDEGDALIARIVPSASSSSTPTVLRTREAITISLNQRRETGAEQSLAIPGQTQLATIG